MGEPYPAIPPQPFPIAINQKSRMHLRLAIGCHWVRVAGAADKGLLGSSAGMDARGRHRRQCRRENRSNTPRLNEATLSLGA
jgi:hypothetical protein